MATAAPATETVTLGDGTSFQVARVPDCDDATWAEMKTYLEGNPDVARKLQAFARDPEKVRGFMQTQAIASYYSSKAASDEKALTDQFKALESDPELKAMFDEVKEGGLEAMMKFWEDEELMLKISRKMGGVPEQLKPALQKIEAPLTLHEAAKEGDLQKVQEFLSRGQAIDAQDLRGVTPLGYAIGTNRIAVVKCLLDGRANPHAVDANGNSGLHYAAGYGRKELCEYLIRVNANINHANSQGQTPLAVSTVNRHAQIIQLLQANGARA
jgi:hypothetical protein